MQIDCIIPCVGYDDFLDLTLPFSKPHFDSTIVVTMDNDVATKKCCQKHGVLFLCTDEWYTEMSALNKGRALNEALHLLKCTDWVCSLDADIVLPNDFRGRLDGLDRSNLYSARRRMCLTVAEYHRFLADGNMSRFTPAPLSGRTEPILLGYLQLWCQGLRPVVFPVNCPSAEYYDVAFCRNWNVDNRKNISDLSVLHLGDSGINWNGRVSERW